MTINFIINTNYFIIATKKIHQFVIIVQKEEYGFIS